MQVFKKFSQNRISLRKQSIFIDLKINDTGIGNPLLKNKTICVMGTEAVYSYWSIYVEFKHSCMTLIV